MADKATQGRLILPETTAAELETSNPILKEGQLFITKDGVAKIGDGATRWASLSPVIPNSMMKWHGQWVGSSAQNTVVYKPNMVVLYREVPYVCIKQHTLPPGPLQGGSDVINPTMPEYWTRLIPPIDNNIGKGFSGYASGSKLQTGNKYVEDTSKPCAQLSIVVSASALNYTFTFLESGVYYVQTQLALYGTFKAIQTKMMDEPTAWLNLTPKGGSISNMKVIDSVVILGNTDTRNTRLTGMVKAGIGDTLELGASAGKSSFTASDALMYFEIVKIA